MLDDQKIDQSANTADQETDNGEGEKNQQTDAGEGQGTDTEKISVATDTGKEDASGGQDKGEGDNKETSKGQDKNAKVPPKDTQQGSDDGAEPEIRKRLSPQDFIIQRQQRKLSRQAKASDIIFEENNESEEDEIAPEDEALIKKVVAPMLQPVLEKTLRAEDEQEIKEFLTLNPDFKPFEAKARRFMQHPSRRQLPIKSIFYEVAGDQLLKIGADRKAKADEKAKQTQTGGGSNRAGEGEGRSDWELSKEEFEAKKERIRQSGRL